MTATEEPITTRPAGQNAALALASLVPAPYNPRAAFDDIEDLAASMRIDGVLEPLLVRAHPKGKGRYEIIAGLRRARAAALAGIDTVPTIILDVGTAAARRICATENLQREDLHPLEEALAIQNLVDDFGVTAAAEQLGKPLRYVARRSNLLTLSPKWKKAIARDGRVAKFPAPILELVALLAPAQQDQVLKEHFDFGRFHGTPDIEHVERVVGDYLRTLKRATWKLDDAELVPKQGACIDCTRHSGAAPGLYEDQVEGKLGEATCRDLGCWEQKSKAVAKRKLDKARAEHGKKLILVKGGWTGMRRRRGVTTDGPVLGKPELSDWEYTVAKKNAKGAVPAFIVEGKGLGTVRWIKRGSTSTSRSGAPAKKSAPKVEPGSAEDLKAKRARLRRRRDGYIVDTIREGIVETLVHYPRELVDLAKLVYAYGIRTAGFHTFSSRKKAASRQDLDALWKAVRGNIVDSLTRHNASGLPEQVREAKWLLAEIWAAKSPELLEALEVDAAEAIPKPKSLVALEKRGTRVVKKKARKKAAAKKAPAKKTSRSRAR